MQIVETRGYVNLGPADNRQYLQISGSPILKETAESAIHKVRRVNVAENPPATPRILGVHSLSQEEIKTGILNSRDVVGHESTGSISSAYSTYR